MSGRSNGKAASAASKAAKDATATPNTDVAEQIAKGEAALREQIAELLKRAEDGDAEAEAQLAVARHLSTVTLQLVPEAPSAAVSEAPYTPVGEVRELSKVERDGKTIVVLADDVRTWKEER